MRKEIKKEKMSLEKLATMVANGFSDQEKKLTEKIDGVEKKLTEKIDGVEKKLTEKIDGVEKKLTEKIDGVEARLGQQINGLGNRIDVLVDDKVSWTDHKRLADRVSRLEMATHSKK